MYPNILTLLRKFVQLSNSWKCSYVLTQVTYKLPIQLKNQYTFDYW